MIRGSDGLDYENLTEKLLGNPAGTYRNDALKELRRQGTPKDEQKVWTDAYEAEYARQVATRGHLGANFADAEACCEADRALRFLHRERNRRVAKPLIAAQSSSSPG